MTNLEQQYETLIWTDGEHTDLVRSAMSELTNVRPLVVGGPRRGEVTELADQLNVPAEDDLRKMIVNHSNLFLLLATTGSVTRELLDLALNRSIDILSIEPPAARIDQILTYEKGQEPTGRLVQLPMWRLSNTWLSSADPLEVVGQIKSLSVTSIAPSGTGSLYARLYDAIDMIIHLLGLPDSIDASLTTPMAELPESLRAMTGHITAHLRFADGAGATVHASDCGVVWVRQLIAIGQTGQLLLSDDSYRLVTHDITEVDTVKTPDGNKPTASAAGMMAEQWRRMNEYRLAQEHVDVKEVMAVCQATLLSCRTGQPESPQTILRLITT